MTQGATVDAGTWAVGAARTINGLVTMNQDAAGSVTFTVTVTADNGGPWTFTYTKNVTPLDAVPDAVLSEVGTPFWTRDKTTGNNDGNINPGENIETRVRLRNTGVAAAQNVAISLAVDA